MTYQFFTALFNDHFFAATHTFIFILLMHRTHLSLVFFSFRAKAQSSDETLVYKYYKSIVVRNGDTLWDYAGMYGGDGQYSSSRDYIKEVMQLNSLHDHKIVAGQYLILPYYSPAPLMEDAT